MRHSLIKPPASLRDQTLITQAPHTICVAAESSVDRRYAHTTSSNLMKHCVTPPKCLSIEIEYRGSLS